MAVVEKPEFGRFYSIAHKLYDSDVDLLSGRAYRGGNGRIYYNPIVIAEIPSGSMVWFLGKDQSPELHGEFYKIGWGECFGHVRTNSVIFFDLGE